MRDDDDPAARCNLGDVSDGLEPARKPYRPALTYDVLGWPEWLVRHVPVWFGLAVLFGFLTLVAFLLVLFAAGPSLAQDERQVRRDCTRDALRYCTVDALSYLKRPTQQNRDDVITCMVANRDKLSAACARHLW